jgi:hypothetical protein
MLLSNESFDDLLLNLRLIVETIVESEVAEACFIKHPPYELIYDPALTMSYSTVFTVDKAELS